ncbi:MAG: hypothetical protein H6821_02765 [Planctomycetaceae bacterium]|nr:hypothetical protein [Planctomycetaceae bacterium]
MASSKPSSYQVIAAAITNIEHFACTPAAFAPMLYLTDVTFCDILLGVLV